MLRVEQLGERGVSAAEVDSASFARSLLNALRPEMTPRALRHLVAAFSMELDSQEAERLAGIALRAKAGSL
jgi:hypothetical protein